MWRVIFSIFVATTLVGATPSDEDEKKDTLQHYADMLIDYYADEEAPQQEALQQEPDYMETTLGVPSGFQEDELQEYRESLFEDDGTFVMGYVNSLRRAWAGSASEPAAQQEPGPTPEERLSQYHEGDGLAEEEYEVGMDPSIEPPARKRLRTCAKEVLPAFLMEWEGPECEGRPPLASGDVANALISIEPNGGQHHGVAVTALVSGGGSEPIILGMEGEDVEDCVRDPQGVLGHVDDPVFSSFLNRFLTDDVDVRRMKYTTPAKVWERHFSHSALVELCEAKQRGGTGLLDKLWSMTQPRTPRLKRYVVYMSFSRLVFKDWSAYETFLAEFEAYGRGRDVYVFGEPLPYENGYLTIEMWGVGEGADHARAKNYEHYRPLPHDKPSYVKKCKSSIYQSAHCAVQKTEGAFWRTCPVLDQPLFEVRTLYNYGTSERRRGPGRALEAVAIVEIMLNTRGRVIWNKQIGANQKFMFHPVYHYEHPEKFDGRASVGGEAFTYRSGCYFRINVADAYFSEGEDELEVCIEEEDPDFTLRYEPQMMEMLVFACGELSVTHEAIEAIVDASDGLPYRFEMIEYASVLIEDARQTMGEPEAPFDLFVDPERLARVRIATGLVPSHSYVILSDEGKPLRDALVAAGVLRERYSMPELVKVEKAHRHLVTKASAFVKAAGLTEGEAVRADEVLALVRRHDPTLAGSLDRFLAELVPLWVASDKKMYLLEDARMLAAARHAAGVIPSRYEWLLGDGDLAKQIRDTLAELGLFCGKPADADDINDAHAALLKSLKPSKLAEAMEGRVTKEAIDGVRVAVFSSKGWHWDGVTGLECVLVEAAKRCPKPCEEGLLASVPRLVEARNACPNLNNLGWLKALLEPHHDDGIAVRSAMEEAGLVRDVASVVVFDVQGTWTHEACVKAGFEVDKCAATVADVRLKVLSMKGVQWSKFDRIVAAAMPLAKEEGGQLFEAKVLAEAIKRSDMSSRASIFYPFLGLANDGDPTAVAVRQKLDGLHAGEAYTLATETAVKELVTPPKPPPKFYLAAQEVGFKDMDLESAKKVLGHFRSIDGVPNARAFDEFLAELVKLAAKDRVDATDPLELFGSAEKVAEASKGMAPSNTYTPYLRGLDFLDKKSDFKTFEAAYSETNAWKKLPRRGQNWKRTLKSKLTKEATAALEIQKLLVALGIERAGSTRATWAAAYDAHYPPATDNS